MSRHEGKFYSLSAGGNGFAATGCVLRRARLRNMGFGLVSSPFGLFVWGEWEIQAND
jgi:hypothetical protein